jgi:hypothetical protein
LFSVRIELLAASLFCGYCLEVGSASDFKFLLFSLLARFVE